MSEPFFAAMQDAAKKAQKRTSASTPDGQPVAKRPGVDTEALLSDDPTLQGQSGYTNCARSFSRTVYSCSFYLSWPACGRQRSCEWQSHHGHDAW